MSLGNAISQGQTDGTLDAELSGKLEDAEIQRLVALSQATEYQRSERVPFKAAQAFEPRSLVSIAMDAQRRRKEETRAATAASAVADITSDAAANSADDAAVEDGGDAQTIAESDSEIPATAQDGAGDSASSETGDTAAADGSADQGSVENADTDGADANNQDEAAEGIAASKADFDAGRAEGLEEGSKLGFEDGHAKGMAEGRAAGSAEASAQLERAIQAFETATVSLRDLTEIDSSALSASIRAAILQLAGARAGQVISDMPAAFVSRIESMINKVRTVSGEPVIRLNSADFAAVAPLIETREKLRHCHFVADNDLANGDLSVTVGNIGIDDFLLKDDGLYNGSDTGAVDAEQVQPPKSEGADETAVPDNTHQQDTNQVMAGDNVIEKAPADSDVAAEEATKAEVTEGDAGEAPANAISVDEAGDD
jgi:flagellar biosynthesis/type III secretory pathway protein FliH